MTLLLLASVQAATIRVDAGGGGDATTIGEGLALAATGDIVSVAAGTYVEDVDFAARTVSLIGTAGSEVTTIQGSGTGPVVRIDSGEAAGTTLAGFTITGGNAEAFGATSNAGGGLHSRGVPLVVEDLVFVDNLAEYGGGMFVGEAEGIEVTGCVFSGNRAQAGAGLYVYQGSATISEVLFAGNVADLGTSIGAGGGMIGVGSHVVAESLTFDGNTASTDGGQLYLDDGSLTCTFCSMTGGSAPDGAAIYAGGTALTLTSSSLTNHVASGGGGGLYARGGAVVSLYATSITGNEAEYGGGVLVSGASLEGRYVTLVGNYAQGGGGAYVQDAELSLTNVLVSENTAATANGGGIALDGSTAEVTAGVFTINAGYSGGAVHIDPASGATLTNVTLTENSSSNSAGGVRVQDGGTLTMSSSIVAYSTDGSGISAGATTRVLLTYSDLYTNAGGATSGGLADPTGTNGNLAENPLFVAFAEDGAYGDDLHLASGSPCADAGDPALTDVDGSRADMGAYGGTAGGEWDGVDWDVDGYTVAEGDCDDTDESLHPGAYDGCDDRDQDCDGTTRENCDTGDTAGTETGGTETGDDTAPETGDDSDPETGDDTGTAKDDGGCACGTPGSAGGILLLLAALSARRARP